MNLTLFHPPNPDGSPRNFKMKDRLNGWTRLPSCRFLEWTGWYNYSLAQRLLGHYRLFQHFKTRYPNQQWEFSAVRAYILDYRTTHDRKFSFFRKLRRLHALASPKDYYSVTQVAAVNHMLINEGSGILQEFLAEADIDFAASLARALEKINDPSFLDSTAVKPVSISVSQYNQFNTKNEVGFHQFNMQPVIREGAKGKEKGVFSKWQILIILDLLSELGGMENLDLSKTNRHAGIAALLHAITGKSKDSIIEELNEYRHKGLYDCKTEGEIDQLINVLINLADLFRQAGFKALPDLVEKKLISLRRQKRR